MQQEIDPRYTFFFAGSDGRTYSRQIYWDSLYAFSFKDETILGAARVVPYTDTQYALYLALKRRDREPIAPERLLGTSQRPLLDAPKGEQRADLVAAIAEVLPDRLSSIPQDVMAESEKRVEDTISEAMVHYGLRNGLGQFSDPTSPPSMERPDPTHEMSMLAGLKGEDIGWVNLSFQVNVAIKEQLRESLEANASDRTLAVYSDFEDDLWRRLYSNPEYLEFVKRVMNTQGGYLSPVVRDFLSFYTRCLGEKLGEYAEEEHIAPDILKKRLESVLGSEKEDLPHYVRNHYDLTILGYVGEKAVPEDKGDPDRTAHSFRVDSSVDLGEIVLKEIEGTLRRVLTKTFIRHNFSEHHNIKSIQYVDEVERS